MLTTTASVTTTSTDPNLANNSAVTTTKANSRPAISAVANQTINEDTSTGPIAFTIGDLETPAASLAVSATSSNSNLLSAASFRFGGSGGSRTLTILPLTNQFGAATIILQVTDADGATASTSFSLTVNPVNDPPTLNPIGNLTLFLNAAPQTVNLSGISAGPTNEIQVLTVSATSSNTSVVPNPVVHYLSPNTTGNLAVAVSPNATGASLITVTVQDNGGTANGGQNSVVRTFLVNVGAYPTLRITRNNNVVVLSWPTNAAGFHLQSRPDLADPSVWTQVGTTPKISGDQNFVTNSLSGSYRFFRLSNP